MSFFALTREDEIKKALNAFAATMKRGGKKRDHIVGFPSGSVECTVQWRGQEGIWCYFDREKNRSWCPFGLEDPSTTSKNLDITAEINVPFKGTNRRVAGVFARDDRGNIYVAHSGMIGGSGKGVGKSAFERHYRGEWEDVIWPDGKQTEMVVIGRVDAARLPAQIATFVHEVDRIKKLVKAKGAAGSRALQEPTFGPEFSGARKPPRRGRQIESKCDHGLVVNALASELQSRGYTVGNDRRDLFTLSRTGKVTALFEAKTDIDTGSIYQAVGQLMFHGAVQSSEPTRIAVLPGRPDTLTRQVLDKLGIRLLSYRLEGSRPRFRGFDTVLSGILRQ